MKEPIILVVDDNPGDAMLTERAFRKSGVPCTLVMVADGQEALDYLWGTGRYAEGGRRAAPALILLDINLPRLSGYEVLCRVRADPRTRRLPIVMLTSSREDGEVGRCYDAGTNGYIQKPIDMQRFIEIARELSVYWLTMNEAPPATGEAGSARQGRGKNGSEGL